MFAEKLRKREITTGKTGSLLADLVGTKTWGDSVSLTCSYHWRSLADAKLVLHQMFDGDEKWRDVVAFFDTSDVACS